MGRTGRVGRVGRVGQVGGIRLTCLRDSHNIGPALKCEDEEHVDHSIAYMVERRFAWEWE